MDYYSSIRTLDIFGDGIPVSFKNDVRYKTFTGGVLTIIFLIISFILLVGILVWYFQEIPYKVIAYEEFDFSVSIDISNSPILFSVHDLNGTPIELDERLFNFKITNLIREVEVNNGNIFIKEHENEIKMKQCDQMLKELPNYLMQYSKYNLSNYMCVIPGQNLYLNGSRAELMHNYSGLRLYVNRCDSKLRTDCYNETISYDKSKQKYVFFTFISDQYDYQKRDHIGVDEVYSVMNTIPLIDTLYYYYRITKTEINYNTGGFFKSTVKKSTFKIESYHSEQESTINEQMYGYLEFSTNGKIEKINRYEESIITYIGIISGLINAVFILLRCFVFLFYDKLLILDVLESFVNDSKKSDNKKLKFKNISNHSHQITQSKVILLNKYKNNLENLRKQTLQGRQLKINPKEIKNLNNTSFSDIGCNIESPSKLSEFKYLPLNEQICKNKKELEAIINKKLIKVKNRSCIFLFCPMYIQQKYDYFLFESSVIRSYSRIVCVLNFWETQLFIDSYFGKHYKTMNFSVNEPNIIYKIKEGLQSKGKSFIDWS